MESYFRHGAIVWLRLLVATLIIGVVVVFLSQVDWSWAMSAAHATSAQDEEYKDGNHPEQENEEPLSAIYDVMNEEVVPDKHQWELLQFYDDDETRIIKEVRFILTSADVQYWNRLCHDGDKLRPIDIRIVERDRLKSFAKSCNPLLALCVSVPEQVAGGSGGSASGRVEVTTTRDRFTVWIYTSGFSLDRNPATLQSSFFSVFLADWLEDVYFRETRRAFPNSFISYLTGLKRIQDDQSACRTRRFKELDDLRQRMNTK